MVEKRHFYWLVFIMMSSWSAQASSLVVKLRVEKQSVIPFEPITVEVNILNTSSKPVQITPLSIVGDNPNIVFYVNTGAETYRIVTPVLVIEQIEGNLTTKRINIQAGQTISYRFMLGVDWATEKSIFHNGINWLFCVFSGYEKDRIESEKRRVVMRVGQTQAEVDVGAILEDLDTRRSLYVPDYLLLVNRPKEIVASVRRIEALEVHLAIRARQILELWKVYQKDAREGRAPGLKSKGFDELGLKGDQD